MIVVSGTVILLVASLVVFMGLRQVRREREVAETTLLGLASIVSADVSTYLEGASRVLDGLAVPALSALSDGSCAPWAETAAFLPETAKAMVTRLDGTLVCASTGWQPGPGEVSYADREWFRSALESDETALEAPLRGKGYDGWLAAIARRVREADGSVAGVTTISFQLIDLESALHSAVLPPNTFVSITDGDGIVLARSTDAEEWIGRRADSALSDGDSAQRLVSGPAGGEGDMLFGVEPVPLTGWLVHVGLPADAILAPARASTIETGFLALGGSMLVLFLAGFGHVSVVRPLGQLVRSTRSAVLGETDRIDVKGPRELVDVAAQVDDALRQRRDTEERIRRSREQLRALNAHLQTVREEEQQTLARELHDEIAQAMTALQMDLHWLRQGDLDRDAVEERLDAMKALAESAIEAGHRISTRLRPGVLDDFGLRSALEWLAEDFERRAGIKCVVEGSADAPADGAPVDTRVSTALFRIVQEALTNVIRHAEAGSVLVRLDLRGDVIALEVVDDGRGVADEDLDRPASLGVLGMRERAAAFGGTVTIRRGDVGGTAVRVSIPRPSPEVGERDAGL
jgi:signal transduction histidine kinase